MRRYVFILQKLANTLRQTLIYAAKHLVDFGISLDDFCAPGLVPLCAAQRFGGRFERMAKGSVADIVQQGGQQRDLFPLGVPSALAPARDDIRQPPRHVIDADAVGETAVCGGRGESTLQ